jgi:glycosyltransferase involved in cell wall biosynthesis
MVVHSAVPADPRVMAQVRAAREGGFDVDIVSLQAEGEARAEILERGARVFRLPVSHRRGAGLVGVVQEYLSFTTRASLKVAALHARRPYDVVEIHNPPDFLVLAALVPKLRGAAAMLDIHDLAPDMFDSRFGGRRGAGAADRLLRVVERAATRFADHVLTVHEPYRQELISRGVPPERITVVMNSVDERLLPPAPAPVEAGFRIVYHGTVTPHYGVELLVGAAAEAARSVDALRLEVYGDGDAVGAAVARAAALGFGKALRIVSQQSRRDVLRAVSGAAVGVVPNLPTRLNRFALSTKLFEYVALGIPAVVADLPTLRMHFGDDDVLFFRAGDERALSRALVQVAEDPDAAQARARAALCRYEEYRWERNAERYLDVLRAVSSSRRVGARQR